MPFRCLTLGLIFAALLLCSGVASVRADQVQMKNGDRYIGKVVSLNSVTLVLQSEVLGRVRLRRDQIALIQLGDIPEKPLAAARRLTAPTNAAPMALDGMNSDLANLFRQLGGSTNLVQQVQKQFLNDAGPEANKQFNQLLSQLMSGKMNMADLRAKAKQTADQTRALRKDLGDQAGFALDGYLAILDDFLKETAPAPPTNPPPVKPRISPRAQAH